MGRSTAAWRADELLDALKRLSLEMSDGERGELANQLRVVSQGLRGSKKGRTGAKTPARKKKGAPAKGGKKATASADKKGEKKSGKKPKPKICKECDRPIDPKFITHICRPRRTDRFLVQGGAPGLGRR